MNFVLPQFIEMETKIVGPLTLKQFAFIAIGGVFSFMVYFGLGSVNMTLAVAIIVVIMGSAGAIAFVKMDGISITTVIMNSIKFSLMPRVFIWKNFDSPVQVLTTQATVTIKKSRKDAEAKLTTQKSSLKKMRGYLETK